MTDQAAIEIIIGAAAALIAAFIYAAVVWLWKIPGRLYSLENAVAPLKEVPGRLARLEGMVEAILTISSSEPTVIAKVKSLGKAGTNPYDLNPRNELLDRYQFGTINVEEAHELQGYLEEDREREVQNGKIAAAVILGGIAVGLGALAAGLAVSASRQKPGHKD